MTRKYLALLFLGLLLGKLAEAQTIFTFKGIPVSTEEFVTAYKKNPEPGNQKKAMENYLPLYINYRLKLQEAKDLGMDTLESVKNETLRYREQLMEGFINQHIKDTAFLRSLLQKAQTDILLHGIFLDRAKVKEAEEAYQALKQNAKAWNTVLQKYSSNDENKKSGGLIGWITVGSLPPGIENVVYTLPLNGISEPQQVQDGYFIFRKTATRKALGTAKAAQVLVENKSVADSVYALLKKGENLGPIAQRISKDVFAQNSGILPDISVGQMDEAFTSHVFNLKKPGDVTPPFKTDFGWHVVQLIAKVPVPATLEDAFKNDRLLAIRNDPSRSGMAVESYIKNKLPAVGYREVLKPGPGLWNFTLQALDGKAGSGAINNGTLLFKTGRDEVTAMDWIAYALTKKHAGAPPGLANLPGYYQEFIQYKAMEHWKENMENYEPVFARQLSDFNDANLLFETMERHIWSIGPGDSVALKKIYNENPAKFQWGPGVSGILFSASDTAAINSARKSLAEGEDWKNLPDRFGGRIYADSGRFEMNQLPFSDIGSFKPGYISRIYNAENEQFYSFIKVSNRYESPAQKSFEEAKGAIISELQSRSEKKWIEELRKKYPVVIKESTWSKLLQSTPE